MLFIAKTNIIIKTLNDEQHYRKSLHFYNIMKKFTILAYFNIISSCLMYCLFIIFQITGHNVTTQFIEIFISFIDANIAVICMAIQFPFGDFIYNPLCKQFEKLSIFKAHGADIVNVKQQSKSRK